MSFFSRFYDFEKFPGIPREKFPNSQFFPFPWEKNLGGKTETLIRKMRLFEWFSTTVIGIETEEKNLQHSHDV